jgi:hypothetical protein
MTFPFSELLVLDLDEHKYSLLFFILSSKAGPNLLRLRIGCRRFFPVNI